ncbi:MAG: efflux transporter outer membrane subunit [Sediminicola sp.]|tara:strand:- start:69458 stop:70924 length:1467 start_codon:yes stop_codon:yes gene_type:complete
MLVKKANKIYLVTLLFIGLTGCKVGKQYDRPDLGSFPKEFHKNDSMASVIGDSTRLSQLKWSDFFNDPTLISFIDTALVNNQNLQKTIQVLEMDRQDLVRSKANFYPSLGLVPGGFQREYASENFNNYGSNRGRRNHGENVPETLYTERLSYNMGVRSSWELGLWGKLRWKKDAALAEYLESSEFKKAVQTALVAEVAATYYGLLKLKAELEVAEKNLKLNENTLRIVELQYEAGETSSLAIRQTKSQKLRFQSLIPKIQRQYAVQENRLNALLGRAPQKLEIRTHLDNVTFADDYNIGVPLELVQNRPDVAASEYALIASNAAVGIAQAMKYPSLSIDAGLGLDAHRLNKLFDPMGSAFALLNGSIFQPIFQNGKLKANHRKAIAARQIAQLDFYENLINAIREVSDAMITIEKLEEEHTLAEERIETTQRGITDAALLFQSGFANYLEVITAQGDALDSELNLIDIKTQIFLGNIELYRSLGGGWQ